MQESRFTKKKKIFATLNLERFTTTEMLNVINFITGGILETMDFNMDYKVFKENAMRFDLGDYYLYTMGGNSGGPVMGLILNILKGLLFVLFVMKK